MQSNSQSLHFSPISQDLIQSNEKIVPLSSSITVHEQTARPARFQSDLYVQVSILRGRNESLSSSKLSRKNPSEKNLNYNNVPRLKNV